MPRLNLHDVLTADNSTLEHYLEHYLESDQYCIDNKLNIYQKNALNKAKLKFFEPKGSLYLYDRTSLEGVKELAKKIEKHYEQTPPEESLQPRVRARLETLEGRLLRKAGVKADEFPDGLDALKEIQIRDIFKRIRKGLKANPSPPTNSRVYSRHDMLQDISDGLSANASTGSNSSEGGSSASRSDSSDDEVAAPPREYADAYALSRSVKLTQDSQGGRRNLELLINGIKDSILDVVPRQTFVGKVAESVVNSIFSKTLRHLPQPGIRRLTQDGLKEGTKIFIDRYIKPHLVDEIEYSYEVLLGKDVIGLNKRTEENQSKLMDYFRGVYAQTISSKIQNLRGRFPKEIEPKIAELQKDSLYVETTTGGGRLSSYKQVFLNINQMENELILERKNKNTEIAKGYIPKYGKTAVGRALSKMSYQIQMGLHDLPSSFKETCEREFAIEKNMGKYEALNVLHPDRKKAVLDKQSKSNGLAFDEVVKQGRAGKIELQDFEDIIMPYLEQFPKASTDPLRAYNDLTKLISAIRWLFNEDMASQLIQKVFKVEDASLNVRQMMEASSMPPIKIVEYRDEKFKNAQNIIRETFGLKSEAEVAIDQLPEMSASVDKMYEDITALIKYFGRLFPEERAKELVQEIFKTEKQPVSFEEDGVFAYFESIPFFTDPTPEKLSKALKYRDKRFIAAKGVIQREFQ